MVPQALQDLGNGKNLTSAYLLDKLRTELSER